MWELRSQLQGTSSTSLKKPDVLVRKLVSGPRKRNATGLLADG